MSKEMSTAECIMNYWKPILEAKYEDKDWSISILNDKYIVKIDTFISPTEHTPYNNLIRIIKT